MAPMLLIDLAIPSKYSLLLEEKQTAPVIDGIPVPRFFSFCLFLFSLILKISFIVVCVYFILSDSESIIPTYLNSFLLL